MEETQLNYVPVPCCICGLLIKPNAASMCPDCLKNNCDISGAVNSSGSLVYCKSCSKYQTSATKWTYAELESPELMKIALGKVKVDRDAKIVNSSFIFTEPHLKRMRLELEIEKPGPADTMLTQKVTLTIPITYLQCQQCCEAATPHEQWNTKVQTRQLSEDKRTSFWLEQQILTHNAHHACGTIVRKKNGLDFEYNEKPLAGKLVNFLRSRVPALVIESRKLISEDLNNMTAEYRYSYLVRCPLISRDDLVMLPTDLVRANGKHTYLTVCSKIVKTIKLVDPFTGLQVDVESNYYWHKPFESLLTRESLKAFVVLSIDKLPNQTGPYHLADVEITDEETYSERFIIRSHLGKVLKEGCTVLGYDLRASAFVDTVTEIIKKQDYPEIVLVTKAKRERNQSRLRGWHLKEIIEHNPEDHEQFESFLDDLENDAEYRQDIQIYRDVGVPLEEPESDDESFITEKDMILPQ